MVAPVKGKKKRKTNPHEISKGEALMLILIKASSMIPHQDHGGAAAAQMDFAYTTSRSRKKIADSVDERTAMS